MAIGHYFPYLFESAIVPWTTLGPLSVVIAFSLIVEGHADYKRHVNDRETNEAPCVVLTRRDEMDDITTPNHNNKKKAGERDTEILRGHDVKVNINKAYYETNSGPRGELQTSLESDLTNISALPVYVHVAFRRVRRANIRQGHFLLVKNREMIPADMVLFASSNDGGSAYIETSSIDGETNLKLRNSPRLPKSVLKALRRGSGYSRTQQQQQEEEETITTEQQQQKQTDTEEESLQFETIEEAVKRITRFSYLGRPDAQSVLEHAVYKKEMGRSEEIQHQRSSLRNSIENSLRDFMANVGERRYYHPGVHYHYHHHYPREGEMDDGRFIAALITEPPNASVHTFRGKLVLPPFENNDQSCCSGDGGGGGDDVIELPLDADNVLLRGAVLRNTEWIIGVACFTGQDTKLIQNSFKTRSKFSQLDQLMNKTVLVILTVMITAISYLATMAVQTNQNQFDELWYIGYNTNTSEPWPYLSHLDPPKWNTTTRNWIQFFLLYVTLLTNFIPLSLYITVEFVMFCMLGFIYNDLDMYDETSNTRAMARSTNITDLGQVRYIFSDKTGTLTQNIMHFKRCSVDGMVFGAPIQKSKTRTQQEKEEEEENKDDDDDEEEKNETIDDEQPIPFHPLRHLLVGQLQRPSSGTCSSSLPRKRRRSSSCCHDKDYAVPSKMIASEKLTFNAEMFLRIMSLCHTVVVEKDLDQKHGIGNWERKNVYVKQNSKNKDLGGTGGGTGGGGEEISWSTNSSTTNKKKSPVGWEMQSLFPERTKKNSIKQHVKLSSVDSSDTSEEEAATTTTARKSPDGAPIGYAYQAESPDEGALVSAASTIYGFQVITRNTQGITLRVGKPSHLEDEELVDGLKHGTISLRKLAADTAFDLPPVTYPSPSPPPPATFPLQTTASTSTDREETWTILAVNKFDSDRKRMSVLLRSPPELGDIPILFCKGADTAMLDPSVSTQPAMPGSLVDGTSSEISVYEEWDIAQSLGLRAQLGDFASDGLRTLVLGLRILTEEECENWLRTYKAASVALAERENRLMEVALAIETKLHIAGATAIEDRLQRGVPETIATLAKAGIKLWVLTGDKRETAVEIGYSSHVLTPKMHVTEVKDLGELHVRTQVAMEFLSLVKRGRLPDYQKARLATAEALSCRKLIYDIKFSFDKCVRRVHRSLERLYTTFLYVIGLDENADWMRSRFSRSLEEEVYIKRVVERRRDVRNRADAIVREWLQTDEGKAQTQGTGDDEVAMVADEAPDIFRNATTARSLLHGFRESGSLSQSALREVSLASLTASQAGQRGNVPLVDEDTLSMENFSPGNLEDSTREYFDKKRRTLLERAFAIDRHMRKGKLRRHVIPEKLASFERGNDRRISGGLHAGSGPRALVIEGNALKHLLGDPELEEILFSVAHKCAAVIACRVSPKQKALLVNLVRRNITPTPITLAIGDGANDVGMIQEAHVGIGISGKEGRQAVNASDFAIAQFRFLEELILIHGRWDFFRLSTVVLFSFYKNAVLAGCLITYASQSVYSGTSLFDEWLIAMVNFAAGIPIIMTGLFDRCLSKDYVRRNPEVYKATQENELITSRTRLRWICMVFIHLYTIYYFTVPALSGGGGMTSAFIGLMRNEPEYEPGNGEGGDLMSCGTVTFSCLIVLLAYKVLYESKSLIHGIWPAFTCRKRVGEGVWSRFAYTWIGVTFLSIGFYFWAIAIYQLMGRLFISSLSNFVDVANHVLGTRSINWMLIAFVPIIGMIFDVCLKVFSNMFYPTQTQIHMEIESEELEEQELLRELDMDSSRSTNT